MCWRILTKLQVSEGRFDLLLLHIFKYINIVNLFYENKTHKDELKKISVWISVKYFGLEWEEHESRLQQVSVWTPSAVKMLNE